LREENGTGKFSERYIKIVERSFEDATKIASAVSKVTSYVVDSVKTVNGTTVVFLDPADEPTEEYTK
jgi:hypothetical protein